MGIKDKLNASINKAINDKLSDAFKDLIIEQEGGSSRVDGEIVTQPPTEYTVKACEDNGSIFGQNEEIQTGTKFFLFLQDHLSVKPELDMKLQHKGLSYITRGIRNDPADVTWILKADLL